MTAPHQTAFTPGPWRIEGRRGAGYIISTGVNAYGDGPESYVGVYDPMFVIPGESVTHAANAALIVAAPALLDALRKLTFAARTSGGTPGPDADLMAACDAAEAAIALAA